MPRGRPIDESADEVRDAALVEEGDVAEAKAWAREHMPSPFTRLAEADTMDDAEVRATRQENGLD